MKLGGLWKSWTRRYFVLCADELRYYASESDFVEGKPPRGSVNLARVTAFCDVPADAPRPCTFCVFTADRKFLIVAASDEERARWMRAVNKRVASLVQRA